jgi:hypothetical protein
LSFMGFRTGTIESLCVVEVSSLITWN